MKHFLDTEFIEGFHKPAFGKRRHFIDLISIGIVREDGKTYSAISSEYRYKDADDWVKEKVIRPLYLSTVHGDARNLTDERTFQKQFGRTNKQISYDILQFFGCYQDSLFWRAPPGIEVYAYYADYDWVLFSSLFGRMIDLPKGFPMFCIDLKQELDNRISRSEIRSIGYDAAVERIKDHSKYPTHESEHDALADAKWNKKLYDFIRQLPPQNPNS